MTYLNIGALVLGIASIIGAIPQRDHFPRWADLLMASNGLLLIGLSLWGLVA